MNILLLNPPAVDQVRIVREGRCMQRQEAWGTSWAPLSLAIQAALLRDAGFHVQLKDCSNDGLSFEDLCKIIVDFKPGLIIANTSTPSIVGDLTVAQLAREIDPGIKTIFFGIHVTALPRETFDLDPAVEFIAAGEPEYTLLDFAMALKMNAPYEHIAGLIYKRDGQIVFNEKRPMIKDLDQLPFPAWDLVNIEGYRLPITDRPFLLVLTGRGCPYPCMFCAAKIFYGQKSRLRSRRKIVSEIKHVRDVYGIHDFLFWSENSTADRQQMLNISEGLSREVPDVRWVCNGRVDMVDEELLAAMKKGGCWMIGYGIEAGTQRVLDLMKKKVTLDQMKNAVSLTRQAGIEVTGHVIVGYPGETKNEIEATRQFVKQLDFDYIQVYCCVPFPGSDIYTIARENGYIISDDWAMFEQNFSILSTPVLSAGQVMKARENIIRDFYLNPRKILKNLMKIRSWKELKFFIAFAVRYFSAWVGKAK